MRKVNIIAGFLFVLLISLSFLSINVNEVIGQTTSSSSGELTCMLDADCPSGICASGKTFLNYSCGAGKCNQIFYFVDPCLDFSSSSGVTTSLSNNFSGVWKARIAKPFVSSSSGECIACIQIVVECTSGQILIPQTCTECAHCTDTTSISSTSSSGTVTNILAHLDNDTRGSGIITFKLCVRDGELEGVVHQGGVFINGKIISQKVISENEVEFTATDKNGRTATIRLKLTGERQFIGTFADGHTFEGRKVSLFKSCLKSCPSIPDCAAPPEGCSYGKVPKKGECIIGCGKLSCSSSGGFGDCASRGNCRGPNGTYLTCPSGTECSGLPVYGCYPPGCPVPICLSPDTKISMKGMKKRVADINEGDIVLSNDEEPVKVIKTSMVEVKNHKILKVTFNDATVLEISPGHPTSEGRLFKDLKVGDFVDKKMIVIIKEIPYKYKYTYDILPDSKTGNYYANGVLIGSTLK